MSSKYVRDTIKAFFASDIPSEKTLDVTALFGDINNSLTDAGIAKREDWTGLQFVPSSEEPVSVTSNNTTGKYRERGIIFLHVVHIAKADAATNIVDRSEILRNAFRGQRIGDIIIEGVTPPNFESGATLQFDGGWTSAAIIVNYYRDENL